MDASIGTKEEGTMWLPRDERRLLAGLAVKLRTVMDEQGFEMVSLLRLVQANFSTPIVPVCCPDE